MNAARPRADYAEVARLLPSLVPDLHAHLPGPHRAPALSGLVDAYTAARVAAKALAGPDLAQVASRHISDAAAALSGPEWEGLAAWSRVQAIAQASRSRAYAVATRTATEIGGCLDQGPVAQVYGSLHLTASLAAMALGRPDTAQDHVAEAAEVAARAGVVGPGHGRLWFGTAQVDIWRTTLAVEQGEPARAVEIARGIDPSAMPESPSRQSSWWTDVGRALAMQRRSEDAVRAFMRAESLAPQRLRSDVFAREVTADLLRRARREAGGRELRGLAFRMGMAA
ncbi:MULTISPECIES: hypothetical protein [Pseudonocardia]|uniref:Uncharacterized protein n=2 Tax=Pseudonocardia TaxID=1847 RepID=A0A1Y2N330_PSEAH|nr:MULTISPECIES: hypothetical protein [Pseudonocardia]OSY41872.1 hypothetical protein BG845_01901 [Pseudonocardia autotrophica]TDN71076.1 hypothetical protein C8E95_0102 [Pseudonocardia autotrophica]BBG01746.1 hypothetical protein Pdca_29550 [Pseudonocardia autotrophica]GEC26305.1 hypothetical protein PSA01_33340 [Pseudonocardia saturnea]